MNDQNHTTENTDLLSVNEWQQLRRHWLVVCTTKELKRQPIARTVLGVPLVIFRDGSSVHAVLDRCSHRNAPLSAGRIHDGCIQCPYHGWRFNGKGHCVQRPGILDTPPQETAIESFPTTSCNNFIWVCLSQNPDEPPASRPWFAKQGFGNFTWIDCIDASFGDALENLLDATHTPFVHSGLVRSESSQQLFSAIVRVKNGIVEAEYIDEGKQAGWISKLFERNRSSSFGRFIPPCIAELEYTSKSGTEFVLNSYFTPESPDRLRVYSTIFLRRTWTPLLLKRLIITPFFKRVLAQDQQILKLQQDNIRRFGKPDYSFWDGDLLRGWIDTWLQTGHLPEFESDTRIDFRL